MSGCCRNRRPDNPEYAHNYEFDMRYLIIEFIRCKQRIKLNNGICIMKYFTPICNFKGSKKTGLKYPKLEELACFLKISQETIQNTTKDIFGIRTCAKELGVSVDRIRRLIILKKIRPKKLDYFPWAPYKFTPHDQEMIRQCTSMRG